MQRHNYAYLDLTVMREMSSLLLTSAPVVLFSKDAGQIYWANAAGAEFFGGGDIAGLLETSPSKKHPFILQLADTIPQLKTDKSLYRGFRVKLDGHWQVVQCEIDKIKLADGKTAILVGVHPPRKKLKKAQRQLAKETVAALQGFASAAAIVSNEGKLIAASPSFSDTGISRKKIDKLCRQVRKQEDRLIKRPIKLSGHQYGVGVAHLGNDTNLIVLALLDEEGNKSSEQKPSQTSGSDGAEAEKAHKKLVGKEVDQEAGKEADKEAGKQAGKEGVDAKNDAAKSNVVENNVANSDGLLAVDTENNDSPADDQDSLAHDERVMDHAQGPDEVLELPQGDEQGVESQLLGENLPELSDPTQLETTSDESIHEQAPDEEEQEDQEEQEIENEGSSAKEVDQPDLPLVAQAPNDTVKETAESKATGDEAAGDEIAAAKVTETEIRKAEEVQPSSNVARFGFNIDQDKVVRFVGEELQTVVGSDAADIEGRNWEEVAERLGFDQNGRISSLLEGNDTWSGKTVLWPVSGTDMCVPVDLAGLPIFDGKRNFGGFKGFGVVRSEDTMLDPESRGANLTPWNEDSSARVDTNGDAPIDASNDANTVANGEGLLSKGNVVSLRGDAPALLEENLPASEQTTDETTPMKAEALNERENEAFKKIGDHLRIDEEVSDAGESDISLADLDDGDLSQEAENRGEDRGEDRGNVEFLNIVPDASQPTDFDKDLDGTFGESDGLLEDEPGQTNDAAPKFSDDEKRWREHLADPAHINQQEGDRENFLAEDSKSADLMPNPLDSSVGGELDAGPNSMPVSELIGDEGGQDNVGGNAGEAAENKTSVINTDILSKLPTPVIIYQGDRVLFANSEMLSRSGYGSKEELQEAGGIDAILDADETKPGSGMLFISRNGARSIVSPVLQSVPWGGEKALLLSFNNSGYVLPDDEKLALDMARVTDLQGILDTATDGIVILDQDGLIESINASAEALFGFQDLEVSREPIQSLFAEESHVVLTQYIESISRSEPEMFFKDGTEAIGTELIGRELIGKEKNGGLIPLFVTLGRTGNNGKLCAVLRDLTQWKTAEEELVSAKRAAETASEHKSEFLARVSHEIRNPLNSIIGFSDVMIDEKFGPIGNERYREYLHDINRSGAHVLDLINDLLDISKIEAGKLEMTFEAVDLNKIVAETVALLQPQANNERIIVRTSLSRAVPKVVADVRSIRQIVLNLVSNAIKFSSPNGQVIVSSVYEANGEVAMRVRDTGKGMTEDEILLAMKPFHQVQAISENRFDGTGLGLPLTRALVEANRAHFDIESEKGTGTIVHVHFPTQRILAD